MSRLFEGLNEAQVLAVSHFQGPSLVIAGAGSGKTRVLTYRIAHLLEQGVKPSRILALTFTNKAAREMQDRIHKLLGNNSSHSLWMGTFHSVFARILRSEASNLGYPSDFTIYDTIDSKSLLKSIIAELKLDDKIYKPGEVLGRISSAKNKLITPQAYYNDEKIRQTDQMNRRPMMAEVFKLYASRCKKSGAMDFDDLLLNTNIMFRDFPEVLAKYQQRFDFILVDEYQDTNFAQYLIVKKLAEKHHNICVVGDDAQSIYSFRGAMIENILNFRKDYPECQLFKLEQNYRSTQSIVNAANSLIDKNSEQIRKTIFSKQEEGQPLKVVKALTDIEEGFLVSSQILDTLLGQQLQYNDFAILYRTNAQSRIFEEALRKRNIPYKVYGSISFYQRKEIKDMLAYLRMVVNPNDDEAFKRIINYPTRGIGKTTLSNLEELAAKKDVPLWEILIHAGSYNNLLQFNQGTLSKLTVFADLIRKYQQQVQSLDAFQLASEMAAASGILKDLYNGTTPEERSKYENLEELLNGIRDFVETSRETGEAMGIGHYLENVSLLTDSDNEKDEDRNKVSIMTIHSAKGLEFKQVFIAGCEEDLLPSSMAKDSQRELEEERRLFYVAITRAMQQVTISFAQNRYRWGTPTDCAPSRFLKEIAAEYIEWPNDMRQTTNTVDAGSFPFRKRDTGTTTNNFPLRPKTQFRQTPNANAPIDSSFVADSPEKIQSGMTVEHQRFGKGKVIQIEGEMPNRKATVFFQQIKEEKQLLLKFARLRIVTIE
ncbi:MAG: UvrD-helicase domain-containing protein [Bacteroidota bacterium]|nr:MAG: UvrD-helicase domain-containing protein [Bacteroidota bacterium]